MKTNRAYINNSSCISCAGNSNEELFVAICEKKETIDIDTTYVKNSSVAIGKIKNFIDFDECLISECKKVLKTSNLDDFSSTLLVVGSSVGGMNKTEEIFFKDKSYKNINKKEHPIDAIAHKLKQVFEFYDDISFSTACTSSANALGYAKEVIEKGIYKNVLVVGVDALSYTTVCGFHALSVLSCKPCTPFEANSEGMNVAEAIAVLLVQDKPTKPNAVEICGVGYSCDAHHMTQPHPEGLGAISAMQNALTNAKITTKDIEYINAHGTGTTANDTSELIAIATLFNKHKPYVSSTKSTTGHTLGAAGAIEAIICTMALKKGVIPPSKDISKLKNEEIKISNVVVEKNLNYVLSNSFAFGGNNTSLVFGIPK